MDTVSLVSSFIAGAASSMLFLTFSGAYATFKNYLSDSGKINQDIEDKNARIKALEGILERYEYNIASLRHKLEQARNKNKGKTPTTKKVTNAAKKSTK